MGHPQKILKQEQTKANEKLFFGEGEVDIGAGRGATVTFFSQVMGSEKK